MDNVFACENCGKKFLAKEVLQHDAYCPCGETIIAYSIDAAARIAELEAEIVERRKDYSACIRDQDARIAELEAQLAAAQERNVALQSEHLNHVNALHEERHFADPTGHGWRNVEPAYTEEGAERDAELSVGVQAEIGYTPPETVEQRLKRKGWM